MDLSVVVVNWNTREFLRRCLASVYGTVRHPQLEVVVVDNGSVDGSADMVARDFPQAKLIRNEDNRGFARANNQGIRASSGRYVLLLNSDAHVVDCAAELMVAFLNAHPRVGCVGGRVLNPDGSFQSSFADFPGFLDEVLLLTGLSRWLRSPSFPSYPEARSRERRPVDWVGGQFLMVRREAVDAVGLLDEDYFMYAEETDWCYRMNRSGWPVFYLPEARAIHELGQSSRRVPERRRALIYRSKLLFMRKHHGRLPASIFRLLVRGVSVLKLALWLSVVSWSDAERRDRARQQAASYRFLLASL